MNVSFGYKVTPRIFGCILLLVSSGLITDRYASMIVTLKLFRFPFIICKSLDVVLTGFKTMSCCSLVPLWKRGLLIEGG